ncbi:hypothetical protein ANO11243_046650 [Dothideomycetidae sp. 11243]|nr:hypothetical protein ANO11243_046650 [fungal sp. No.11243]
MAVPSEFGLPQPTDEGFIPFKIPSVDRPCFTRYQVYGDLSQGPAIIGLHGGPGAGLVPAMGAMGLQTGLPVVLYDQIGCGQSTLLPEKAGDATFWQMSVFVSELQNLVEYFKFPHGYHLLGVSFGAMLAADFATTQPPGLKRLVLCSPFASRRLVCEGHELRRSELPLDVQKALNDGNESGDFQSEGYIKALVTFYKKTMCRIDPWPPGMEEMFAAHHVNDVFMTMSGPGPTVLWQGSMRDWDVTTRLHRITAQTLVINGEFDIAFEAAVQPFFDLIPRVRWITFPGASHGVMIEAPGAQPAAARFLAAKETELDKGTA